MLKESDPRILLGPYSGIFKKPIRAQNRRLLEDAVEGTLELQGFKARRVDLLGKFDKSISDNRTWWFRFNNLPTLAWASGDWIEGNNALDFIGFNFSVIENWYRHSEESLPLKWHDHASALRGKNLAAWFVTVAENSNAHDEDLFKLADVIDRHLQWLCNDKNYSRRTNHGFDQARFMVSVARELPGLPSASSALQIGLLRLQDEIDFAFTGQGVHKENSPGYQWFMIKLMQEAKTMLDGYELELPDVNFGKTIDRAKRFLCAIALPDNSLPLIGDTQQKDKQDVYVARLRENDLKEKGVKVYDYAKSGYVIVKDFNDVESPIHLVFKNGHLSDYHRHSDDLSIHLAKGNSVIFGDGGLYSHNKDDLGRRYAKSAWAHSTVFPVPLAERSIRRKLLEKSPETSYIKQGVINGKTWLYSPDFFLERQVIWEESFGLKEINIVDSLVPSQGSQAEVVTSFLVPVPEDRIHVDRERGLVLIRYENFAVSIAYRADVLSIRLVDGFSGESKNVNDVAFVSKRMSSVSTATRVEFHWSSQLVVNEIKVSFA